MINCPMIPPIRVPDVPPQCMCHPCPPPHHFYPESGLMVGNAFSLSNSNPYLVDNTMYRYGSFLNMSDEVYTRFTQQRDPSCVNIIASVDLSSSILTNTVLNSYLTTLIGNAYETIDSVLNVMKGSYSCKLTYEVLDATNAIVHSSTASITVDEVYFHETDIKDYFMESMKSSMIFNIPALEYQGLYTLRFKKFEVLAYVIDTATHIVNDLNPYYQFTNNNTKIVMQHNTIEQQTEDHIITIAEANLNQSFQFQGNVTTRVRVAFTTFMSTVISTPNTFDVWKAMFEPTDAIIHDLQQEIVTIKQRLVALENAAPTLDIYTRNTAYTTKQLVWLECGQLYQVASNFTSDNTAEKTTAESFAIDIAAEKLIEVKPKTDSSNEL